VKATQTKFAPAGRADAKSISLDAQLLTKALVHHVTNAIPCAVMILNKHRQIVYKNQGLMDLLSASSDKEVLGKRPGELFDCIHAHECSGGCGTTLFCSECGAAKAILKCQSLEIPTEEEFRLTTRTGKASEFKVWATPYTFSGRSFTVFSLIDITHEKRRYALEKTFFHDINNMLSVIKGVSELLRDAGSPKELASYAESIQAASNKIIEEIASQRRLLEAENGQLATSISWMASVSLLKEIAREYAMTRQVDQVITVAEDSDNVEITTDRTLLLRVLGNMLKNALEASPPKGIVRLSCARNGSSVKFSVNNSGCMPRSTQLQIFQRSFSTKGPGRGIGTYSMKLFGEKYLKGKVWFSTSKKEGTTFYISIPMKFPED